MTYPSVHTGPEIDAAVSVLSDVQDIRTEVAADKATVTTLAGQTATNAGLAQTAATNAQADAASALASKNDAHTSAQTAGAHAANADSARALAVVARNGSEEARDSAWEAEDETRALLSESGPTIDAINAELRRMKYGSGPYPSLELGFVGASMLDRRVTFTRASNATYWDPLGTLQTAGPGEPRFDYDPVTGECLGLLVEGQRTNRWLYSTNLNNITGTTKSGASIPNGPDEYGWCKFNESTNNGPHFIRPTSSFSGEAGKVYSLSFDAKAGEREYVIIRFDSASTALNIGGAQCVFNLLTGEKTHQTSGTEGWWHIEETAGGYRLIATVTAEQNGSLLPLIMTNKDGTSNFSYQGEADHGIYIRHIQFEEGSQPSSYIKTEASQVTRAADSAHVDVGEWFNPLQGTLIFRGESSGRIPQWDGYAVLLNTANNYIGVLSAGGAESVRAQIRVDGVTGTPTLQKNMPSRQFFGAAISYSKSDARAVIDGDSVLAIGIPPAGMAYGIERLEIGKFGNPGSLNTKRISSVVYYPRAFPDAKLVELSTL